MKRPPDSGPIWTTWLNGGAIAGQKSRPHGRVTVQPSYYLNQAQVAGGYLWTPVRWFQDAANDQTEVEVTGIQTIETVYSIDADSASATIVLANNAVLPFGQGTAGSEDFGEPGYLTPDRGTQSNRWGYTGNAWQGVLGPNALLRTYQGYGGHGKAIEQAVSDGNLVLTGVWLVDEADVSADQATLTLKCRNMAKLLLDQYVFPGLEPANVYPISFYANGQDLGSFSPVEIYGHVTGTFPAQTGNQPAGTGIWVTAITPNSTSDGYWLLGTDGGIFSYGHVHFWGCPNGKLILNDFCVGMAATKDSGGYWVVTNRGRIYAYGDAAFEHCFGDATGPTPGEPPNPIVGMARMGDTNGYVLVDKLGHVYAYGPGATFYGGAPALVGASTIVGIAVRPQYDGYWLLASNGDVYTYGPGATYQGGASVSQHPCVGISSTPSGKGYTITAKDGGVFCFGDASFFGSVPGTILNEVIQNAQVTTGSNVVTVPNGGFQAGDVGQAISGANIPAGTTVSSYTDANDITISNLPTSGTGAPQSVTIARPATVSVNLVAGNQIVSLSTGTFLSSDIGLGFSATNIPAGTTILNVLNPTQAKISNAPLATTGSPESGTIVRTATFGGVGVTAFLNAVTFIQPPFLGSYVGSAVSGDGIPTGTRITSVDSSGQIHISNPATASASVTITVQTYLGTGIPLNDPVCSIAVAPNGYGYWLGAGDGGVFSFSGVQKIQAGVPVYWVKFFGSLPGAFSYYLPGNYSDLTDIAVAFALWSGFYLYDNGATYNVYGIIQPTGITSTTILEASLFDKKPVADAINQIKQIVGYVCYVGDEGEFHWHPANIYESGSILPDGSRTQVIPVIDERVQLTQYTRSIPDTDIRSQIIIGSEDPFPATGGPPPSGTVVTTTTPTNAGQLKGMVKPAMYLNQAFISLPEQQAMAELVAQQLFIRSESGTVTMLANPMLQIEDQVQMMERQSFDLNYHYIRSIDTTMNLKTGQYTAAISTSLLQPGSTALPWVVSNPGNPPSGAAISRPVFNGRYGGGSY